MMGTPSIDKQVEDSIDQWRRAAKGGTHLIDDLAEEKGLYTRERFPRVQKALKKRGIDYYKILSKDVKAIKKAEKAGAKVGPMEEAFVCHSINMRYSIQGAQEALARALDVFEEVSKTGRTGIIGRSGERKKKVMIAAMNTVEVRARLVQKIIAAMDKEQAGLSGY